MIYIRFITNDISVRQDTAAEWRNVFYVCSAVSVFAMVVFACFVRGETQIWAMEPKEITIDIPQINHDKPV